jgi:hypothetical protein
MWRICQTPASGYDQRQMGLGKLTFGDELQRSVVYLL